MPNIGNVIMDNNLNKMLFRNRFVFFVFFRKMSIIFLFYYYNHFEVEVTKADKIKKTDFVVKSLDITFLRMKL